MIGMRCVDLIQVTGRHRDETEEVEILVKISIKKHGSVTINYNLM